MERLPLLAAPAGHTRQIFEPRQGKVTRCGLLYELIDAHFCFVFAGFIVLIKTYLIPSLIFWAIVALEEVRR